MSLKNFTLKITLNILLFLFVVTSVNAQTKIDRTLKQLNKESIPYITVDSLTKYTAIVLLDTREKEEYDVSHLENAIWVGYKEFNIDSILKQIPQTDSEIIVYCSIGVRSEDIGEKLLNKGYTNVSNLYGGIFDWKNKGNPVYDSLGNETEKVHAFNKHWGKLLTVGEKVYDKKKTKRKPEAIPH